MLWMSDLRTDRCGTWNWYLSPTYSRCGKKRGHRLAMHEGSLVYAWFNTESASSGLSVDCRRRVNRSWVMN